MASSPLDSENSRAEKRMKMDIPSADDKVLHESLQSKRWDDARGFLKRPDALHLICHCEWISKYRGLDIPEDIQAIVCNIDAVNAFVQELQPRTRDTDWSRARDILKRSDFQRHFELTRFCEGKTVLHHTVNHTSAPLSMLKLVYDMDPQQTLQSYKYYGTTLHMACHRHNTSDETILFLLDLAPSATTLKDGDGNLPLTAAIDNLVSSAVIQRILTVHPTAVHSTNVYGRNPLEDALEKWEDDLDILLGLEEDPYGDKEERAVEFYKLLALLLDATAHGAVTLETNVAITWTPLHQALKQKEIWPDHHFFLMKNSPLDLLRQDEAGNFPLHVASCHCRQYLE